MLMSRRIARRRTREGQLKEEENEANEQEYEETRVNS